MNTVKEIQELEERLRLAELGPDPSFFEEILSDDAILDGQRAKAMVIKAHQPGAGPKFTRVEMSEYEIIDHGNAAVVMCQGVFEGAQWSGTLKFMRVWIKKNNRWQIIAGTVAKA